MPKEIRPDKAVAALERRAAFLERVENEGTATSYHRQERAALKLALPLLREYASTTRPQGRKQP